MNLEETLWKILEKNIHECSIAYNCWNYHCTGPATKPEALELYLTTLNKAHKTQIETIKKLIGSAPMQPMLIYSRKEET